MEVHIVLDENMRLKETHDISESLQVEFLSFHENDKILKKDIFICKKQQKYLKYKKYETYLFLQNIIESLPDVERFVFSIHIL